MGRETYLNLMERVMSAYTNEQLTLRRRRNGDYLDIQSYARLTCVLACLIDGGRMENRQELWEGMMTACCRELQVVSGSIESDFAVKDIMIAYTVMKNRVTHARLEEWRRDLTAIDPFEQYQYVIGKLQDESKLHNINVYSMAGEYVREREGMTDTEAYFAEHWPIQLERFDENGMYRDPGCPMLYDLTTRCQIMLMLHYGYRGPFYEVLDRHLRKAGQFGLYMQSAAFEGPYGGRSNQYLFHEALMAACGEFEARRYEEEGKPELAGMHKRSARLALESVQRWMDADPPHHIRNGYSVDSGWGTEGYGYYDKYMITMGSFLALAYLFASDSGVPEMACPAETGGYVRQTSPHFHKLFASAGGYSLQIDTNGDPQYDATGLGRIHRYGVPSELCLSVPLSSGDGYRVGEGVGRLQGCLSPGWQKPSGEVQYLSRLGEGLRSELQVLQEEREHVAFQVTYSGSCMEGCEAVKLVYHVRREGVSIDTELINPSVQAVYTSVPLLVTNGQDTATIDCDAELIRVRLGDSLYEAGFNGEIVISEEAYGNRNGEYKLAQVKTEGISASMVITLA
ncbi:hypothetical protein M6D81_07465 [Paenibacillus sp. J5C_2022]|uniref:hypothetical protein n=1 Tax=Paenibacillus sp. J5C2022 TaxID=2977129 RepID=UPI0021D3906E|nr:hypothetical protein [Paenibacillus sp. J5C2022]MCU6708552.1 hypothetical protein [Paenibacillus sp. J5C2022]